MSEAAAAPAAPSAPTATSSPTTSVPSAPAADPPHWRQGTGNQGPRGTPEPAADTADASAEREGAQPGDGQESAEPAPSTERHKVKVNGEEIDVTLDELKTGYGRMKAATQKWQEASELLQEVDKREGIVKKFVEGFKTASPPQLAGLLSRLGVDPLKFAEGILSHHLKLADMPAHERGMLELRQREEAFKREQQNTHAAREEAAIVEAQKQTYDTYVADATSAFQAAGMQATPGLLARAGAAMAHSIEHGYPMTMAEAAASVIEDLREVARTQSRDTLAQQMGDPAAADKLKREEAGKVSREQRQQAATAAQKPRASNGQFVKPTGLDPGQFGSRTEYFDALRELRQGR